MPFKSQAQRRLFYAKKRSGEFSPEMVKKWEEHTPKDKKLPERVEKKAFFQAFCKKAAMSDVATKAVDLAGLGVLAAPSISGLAGKPWSEKKKDVAEVAGLGILAAPAATYLGKRLLSRGKR